MKGWCSPGVRRMAQMESSCVCWWEGRCSQRHFAALDILARLHRWHRSHYSHHVKRFHPLTPGLHGCNEVHQCWRQPREPRSRILGKHLEQLSSVFSHDLAIQNRVASSLVWLADTVQALTRTSLVGGSLITHTLVSASFTFAVLHYKYIKHSLYQYLFPCISLSYSNTLHCTVWTGVSKWTLTDCVVLWIPSEET